MRLLEKRLRKLEGIIRVKERLPCEVILCDGVANREENEIICYKAISKEDLPTEDSLLQNLFVVSFVDAPKREEVKEKGEQ